MARTTSVDAKQELAGRLKALWEAKGHPSLRAIERACIIDMGDGAPTYETLRRMHTGLADPHNTNAEALIAVARYYGVDPAKDLGPIAGARVTSLRRMLRSGSFSPDVQVVLPTSGRLLPVHAAA